MSSRLIIFLALFLPLTVSASQQESVCSIRCNDQYVNITHKQLELLMSVSKPLNDMLEQSDTDQSCITLACQAEIFKLLMQYVQTGLDQHVNIQNALELAELASYLDIPLLLERAIQPIANNLYSAAMSDIGTDIPFTAMMQKHAGNSCVQARLAELGGNKDLHALISRNLMSTTKLNFSILQKPHMHELTRIAVPLDVLSRAVCNRAFVACNVVKIKEPKGPKWSKVKTISVFNKENGKHVQDLLGHTHHVLSLAWNSDKLVSGSHDTSVRLWDVETAKDSVLTKGHTQCVGCVAASNELIVSGSQDATVCLWDARDAKPVNRLRNHSAGVHCLALDDDYIYSCSDDNTICMWDRRAARASKYIEKASRLTSCALKSGLLAAGSTDSNVYIWDTLTGQLQHTFEDHTQAVESIAWKNDLLVSGSRDRTIMMYDVESKSLLRTLVVSGWVSSVDLTDMNDATKNVLVSATNNQGISFFNTSALMSSHRYMKNRMPLTATLALLVAKHQKSVLHDFDARACIEDQLERIDDENVRLSSQDVYKAYLRLHRKSEQTAQTL